jgi:hypothetical protein
MSRPGAPLAFAAVAALLLVATAAATTACGGNVVVDSAAAGTGGAGTSSSTTGATSTTTTTGTTTLSTTTTSGADCAAIQSYAGCYACNVALYPSALPLYTALETCRRCTACFVACKGTAACTSAPPDKGSCDGVAPNPIVCHACLTCSDGAPGCEATFGACMSDPECSALWAGISMCVLT